MNLSRLDLPVEWSPPPGDVADLLAVAQQRIQRFSQRAVQRIPAFVSSNFVIAYHALQRIANAGWAPGNTFCEWGSGFGVVTCVAAQLDFQARGIEIEADLVTAARQLAADFGISAEFTHGNYQPPGSYTDSIDEARLSEQLGFSPFGFDVIYAYPWPTEERVVFELFRRFGHPSGLLVTYHGGADLRVHQHAVAGISYEA